MWLGCHSPPGCGPSLGVLHNISTGDLGSTHKAWWKGGLVAGTPWGGDWRRAHGRHSLRQHRPQSALAARPPCDHPEALTPPPLRTPRMLPRKIGLPAARSFPGNRQEARSGAGEAGLSSRHAGAGSAGSGPAGPSREGGGREEGSGGSSLPAGRGWLFESLSGYGARVPLVSLVLCPSSAPGGLSLGRVSEQRGLWSPACCRSASDQRLQEPSPGSFLSAVKGTFQVCSFFLSVCFCPLLEVCHLLAGRFASTSSLVCRLFDSQLCPCCLSSVRACASSSSWLHKGFHLVRGPRPPYGKFFFHSLPPPPVAVVLLQNLYHHLYPPS